MRSSVLARRVMILGIVTVLVALPGVGGAAESTTTTSSTSTTTTVPESTTSTTSTTTTTIPPTTTTTAPSTTIPSEPESEPAPIDPEDPDQAGDDFVFGTRRPPPLVFPVAGAHSFHDTFGAPRDGGRRRHLGIDIFADKGVPILAVADGIVEKVSEGALAGQYIIIRHPNGWRSKYLHLNNDTPGTNDGLAYGYAEGIAEGMQVVAGTVIGYVGNSGNAERTPPHLHFGLHQPDGLPVNPYRALVNAPEVPPLYVTMAVHTFNTGLVGQIDPDRAGFNAGVAVSGDHAYMGTWGTRGHCPGTGVRVIDVSNPTAPQDVGRFATSEEYPGTAVENIWVDEVDTPLFQGQVAVVAVRLCDEEGRASPEGLFAGLAIYDLEDPADPQLLSTVHSGESTQGALDVAVSSESGRLLAAVTVPQSYLRHEEALGDIRVYDLTDPTSVMQLLHWDFRRDAPSLQAASLRARMGDEALAGHSVSWLDPDHIIVGNSGGGLVTLDVSIPASPTFVASASTYDTYDLLFGSIDSGNHGVVAHGGWMLGDKLLVQHEKRLEPGDGEDERPGEWGQQVLYDTSATSPKLVATFGTENSSRGADGVVSLDGIYSAHHSAPYEGNSELVAWLSDGVRVVDLENPSHPTEVAYFVPPARVDPQGWWVAPDGARAFPMVWSVASDGDLIYASDANSGLWIFEVTRFLARGSSPTTD